MKPTLSRGYITRFIRLTLTLPPRQRVRYAAKAAVDSPTINRMNTNAATADGPASRTVNWKVASEIRGKTAIKNYGRVNISHSLSHP